MSLNAACAANLDHSPFLLIQALAAITTTITTSIITTSTMYLSVGLCGV